jgi:hypothetical protein
VEGEGGTIPLPEGVLKGVLEIGVDDNTPPMEECLEGVAKVLEGVVMGVEETVEFGLVAGFHSSTLRNKVSLRRVSSESRPTGETTPFSREEIDCSTIDFKRLTVPCSLHLSCRYPPSASLSVGQLSSARRRALRPAGIQEAFS